MRNNIFETLLGAVVLVVAGVFLFFSYKSADMGAVNGYTVYGDFTNIDGLKAGSDVKISGVKVGTIATIDLDDSTYRARAALSINPDVKLPIDTVGIVTSEGLLGGKYLALEVGGDEDMLGNGDELFSTQASVSLEKMIGQVLFSLNSDKQNSNTQASTASTAVDTVPSVDSALSDAPILDAPQSE